MIISVRMSTAQTEVVELGWFVVYSLVAAKDGEIDDRVGKIVPVVFLTELTAHSPESNAKSSEWR
jgi:hypothetical protein